MFLWGALFNPHWLRKVFQCQARVDYDALRLHFQPYLQKDRTNDRTHHPTSSTARDRPPGPTASCTASKASSTATTALSNAAKALSNAAKALSTATSIATSTALNNFS